MGCWLMYFHWHWPETSTETHVNRYLYMGAMSNSERIILENWGSHWGSRPCGDFFYHLLRVVPRRGNILVWKNALLIYFFIYSSIYLFIYFFILFIYLFIICFIFYLFTYLCISGACLSCIGWHGCVSKFKGSTSGIIHVRKGFWIQAAPPLEVGGVFFRESFYYVIRG